MNFKLVNYAVVARLFSVLLISCSIRPLWCATPYHFESSVQQIITTIEGQEKSRLFPRVLVIDFPSVHTGVDSSGPYLADDLSVSLESQLPPGTIIPRAKLKNFLNSHGLTPLDLQSVSIAYWAADQLEANEILYGEISATDVEIALHVRLLRLSDTKEVANWDLKLDATGDLNSLLGKALETPGDFFSSNSPLRCSSGDSKVAIKAFIASGGTLPKPIHWPNPSYSDELRRKKLSATRQYDVYWSTKGDPVLIVPHRPLQPEFDEVAVKTIKRWKSQPATQAGQPVAVCVPIEITWRLY